jgi:HTH-type transcriptional regulator/antitoxin HigA
MNLNISREWLLRMAEKEGNGIVSVGGLVTRIDPKALAQPAPVTEPSAWSRLFPLKDMKRLRFSLPKGLSDVEALLDFFGVSSPEGWLTAWKAAPVAFRQTQLFDPHEEAVSAWVREAEIVASGLTLADFDEGRLRSSIDELRRLTRKPIDEALEQAQAICSRAGLALVLVPELPGTRISGCARWLSETHALVGLTIRYKTDDQLWFTFFHEIAHILLHRDRQSFVIDNAAEDMGDEVVDPEMAKYEEEANRFAADTLIPPDALAEFLRLHRKTLTNDEIHDFAESIGIGPGTLIGRLQHDGVLKHWQGNELKQKLNWEFASEG